MTSDAALALSGGLDLLPLPSPRSSSHLRVRCLYKRCLGINVYTRRPFSFPGGSFLWQHLPTTHPGEKNHERNVVGDGQQLLRAAAVGWRAGRVSVSPSLCSGAIHHRQLREPPGRRQVGVPELPGGVGEAQGPGDAPRDTRPKGTGISRVLCQQISLRRILFRGGGVKGKEQDEAESEGRRCGRAEPRE